MNSFTVWAEDGEYQAIGATILEALSSWMAAHPNRLVAAIVDDAMSPGLVLEGSIDGTEDDLTVSDVANNTWPATTRFRPVDYFPADDS